MPIDRTRRFVLPGIQELTKDQDEALALPLEGQHLIVGGPGTGKSVVTLLRARRLAEQEQGYLFLVYNHLLDQSNQHLFGKPLVSKTWNKWFHHLWRKLFGQEIPTLDPVGNSKYRLIDWESVEDQIQSRSPDSPSETKEMVLIIDEGQDMPKEFYGALISLGYENFYVAADQNQQLNPDHCSSREAIEVALGFDEDNPPTLELKPNHRNTRPIALLAQHFCPDDPASPKPDLPAIKPAAILPELWTYGTTGKPSLADIVTRILQLSDRYPRMLIGVITPDNKVRQKFLNALHGENPKLDNGKPPVQTFASGQQDTLDFGQGGIMVINAQSCKGLEFDIAILADIDQHQPKRNIHALQSCFYVMVARGRVQVILLRTGNICPVVEKLLPTDPAILVRR